ncbi:MAG: hydantoinase/carbamoylase family amidase [Actinomycetota bacterium]
MVAIDGARLLASLHELRTFGATGTGVVRPTFSDVDMAARRWLRDQMLDAGLDARIDGVGNVIGRSPNPGPAVVLGSHSDTQPEGGWLDGAMGVMYAIEVARTLLADPSTAHLAVDVAAWADEEGTYGTCLGSRSFVGDLTDDEFAGTNADGESITEALDRVGLSGVEPARLEPGRHVAYLEAHIEQGPHLEDSGNRIGVVTGIVGIRGRTIRFSGEQNHAGSTPMPRRKDAAAALFEFGVRFRERFTAAAGPTSVWTIGNLGVHPGAESIVPGAAWCRVQYRDPSAAVMSRFDDTLESLVAELDAEGPCAVAAEAADHGMEPVVMDPELIRCLGEAAAIHIPDGWVEMPSAAGHDANMFAPHLPCGMLFIPSIGGVSHDFAEDSHEADIVLGCQVFADGVVSRLGA